MIRVTEDVMKTMNMSQLIDRLEQAAMEFERAQATWDNDEWLDKSNKRQSIHAEIMRRFNRLERENARLRKAEKK